MAELMLLSPLFPGVNEEDEIVRICHVLGSPTDKIWKEGMELANQIHFIFPDIVWFVIMIFIISMNSIIFSVFSQIQVKMQGNYLPNSWYGILMND